MSRACEREKWEGLKAGITRRRWEGFDELYQIIAVFICMFEESVPTIFYT